MPLAQPGVLATEPRAARLRRARTPGCHSVPDGIAHSGHSRLRGSNRDHSGNRFRRTVVRRSGRGCRRSRRPGRRSCSRCRGRNACTPASGPGSPGRSRTVRPGKSPRSDRTGRACGQHGYTRHRRWWCARSGSSVAARRHLHCRSPPAAQRRRPPGLSRRYRPGSSGASRHRHRRGCIRTPRYPHSRRRRCHRHRPDSSSGACSHTPLACRRRRRSGERDTPRSRACRRTGR
jgi:hypothetical protein